MLEYISFFVVPAWTLGALIYEMEKMKCSTGVDESRILEMLMKELEDMYDSSANTISK